MALIGNQSVLQKSPAFFTGSNSTAAGSTALTRYNFQKASKLKGRIVSLPKNASIPDGYGAGAAFLMARSRGGVAAQETIKGVGDIVATLWEVKLAIGSLDGLGEVKTAELAVLSPSSATVTAEGEIANAILQAVSSLIAGLSGVGTTNADLAALVPMSSSLVGVGTLNPNLTGTNSLSASITPFTELSPENLALKLLDNNFVENNFTLRESLRLMLSSMAGKVSGAETTTVVIKNVNDNKNRIVATVDANGNRTAVTYDVSDE